MHFRSPLDYLDRCGKVKPSYVQYIIRQDEAALHTLELTSVFHHLSNVGPTQLCALAYIGCTLQAITF